MKQEYTRDERLVGDRFSIGTGGSSARLVREDEIDPAELRRKQAECGGTSGHYIDMFCERYRDRGIAGRVHADAAKQEKAEALSRASAPGAYIRAEELADEIRTGDGREQLDAYRSGVSDGRRYMTVDDFARYYHDQRGYKFPQYRQATDAERIAAVNAVVATRERRLEQPKKAGWLTETDKLPRPIRRLLDKPFFARLNLWAAETFPREAEMRVESHKTPRSYRPIPAGLTAALVTVMVSMAMVISSTVAVSQATRELSAQKEALADLRDMHGKLSDQLALKNDSLDIEDKAKNELGMVPEKYLGGEYLTDEKTDHLEVYDEERDGEKKTGLAWLLSAFGWGE